MLVTRNEAIRIMMEGKDPSKYIYHEAGESPAMEKAISELIEAIQEKNHTFFHFFDQLEGLEEAKKVLREKGYSVFGEGGYGNAVLY